MAKDYYRILGIAPEADSKEIKQAYRRLVMEHHPDRQPGQAESEEHIREINEAYQTLGNEKVRARYDTERGIGRPVNSSSGEGSEAEADFRERFATGIYQPPKRKARQQG